MIHALQSGDPQAKKGAIIIVEDDPSHAEVLDLLLKAAEPIYQTTCFHSGSELLNNLDQIRSLHLVLFILDYRLPGMNGLELYNQLQKIDGFAGIPALMLSGSVLTEEEKNSLLHQRVILIPKPYDIDDILATIEQIIEEK